MGLCCMLAEVAPDALDWRRPELLWWLLLVPVAALLLWWGATGSSRRIAAHGAMPPEPLPHPLGGVLRRSLVAVGVLLSVAEPRWGEESTEIARRGVDVVIALDVSRSMRARDVSPDRLERARQDVASLLPELGRGDRAALLAFSGKVVTVVPPTHDAGSFRQLLDTIDTDTVRFGGSDLAAAVDAALGILEANTGGEAAGVVYLLTDGEDLVGAGRTAAARLQAAGHVLHVVGYGSREGAKVPLEALPGEGGQGFLKDQDGDDVISAMDPDTLRAMAGSAGGEFLPADAVPLPLVELHRKRVVPKLARDLETSRETIRRTRYQWILLPTLLLLLAGLWPPGMLRRRRAGGAS